MRQAIAIAALLLAAEARAQRLDLSLSALSGSGMSAAPGDGQTLTRRSPLFLDVDVGAAFDPDPNWEWVGGLVAELENRMSFGVNPQLKRIVPRKRLRYYATAGLPLFFSPFTLLGAEVGAGAIVPVSAGAAVVVETRADFFFAGSDLPDDGMLAKFDVAIGFRLAL